jgi:hypothetical protein
MRLLLVGRVMFVMRTLCWILLTLLVGCVQPTEHVVVAEHQDTVRQSAPVELRLHVQAGPGQPAVANVSFTHPWSQVSVSWWTGIAAHAGIRISLSGCGSHQETVVSVGAGSRSGTVAFCELAHQGTHSFEVASDGAFSGSVTLSGWTQTD